jgi:hypothetical protein
MREICMSGSMSGEGKPPAASRSRSSALPRLYAPEGVNYRFALTYQSEELRQKWVASDVHQKVWPTIENTLTSKSYSVLLFDVT